MAFRFTYHNPTRVHFGERQIAQLSQEIPENSTVLLLYGGGSVKQNGVYEQITNALEGRNIVEFSGIQPNPDYDTLMEAASLARSESVDFILAAGGGSVVDGAKFIAAAVNFNGDPWTLLSENAALESALPVGVVLTLPATGSETNIAAVISRGDDKLSFKNPLVRPRFAILDPATTLSLSTRQIANGVCDAFVHVMEQYLTYPVGAQIQDRYAESVLLTLIDQGPIALAEPENLEVRSNIMWAATQALSGILGCGVPQDWSTHAIGHEITGLYGTDHARTLTIILPANLRVMKAYKEAKLLQYSQRVWGMSIGDSKELVEKAIIRTEDFFRSMGMPVRLGDIDLTEKNITAILEKIDIHRKCRLGEHGKVGLETCQQILEEALRDPDQGI